MGDSCVYAESLFFIKLGVKMSKQKHNLKNIIKLGVFLTLSVFAFLSYTYFTQAQIPDFVNYQGRLRDNTGNPITAPTTIQFSLYSHITNGAPTDIPSSAGPLLWTETYDGSGGCTQITPGTDGIFAQHLGDCVSFPVYLDFTQEYYLGVKIGADAEASPRVPLSTHPYAFTSKRLNVRDENIYITSENSGDIVLQAADDILFYDTNNDLGLAGEILSSTGSGIDWISPSSFSAGSLWDLDHDTGVQIEEGVDDDTLRIDTAGSQRMAIDNTGNLLLSDTEPASFINPGNLQGLLFRDDKFALRLGETNNNEWDDANVGRGSFASGRNNIVSGNYSTAFGGSNNINDVYATALGRNNTVTGSYAVAGGYQNTAGGYASAVFGQTNQVIDRRAMAWGLDNIASQDETTSWGRNTRASANYATSWGRDTQASGNYSTAFGYQNTASQDYGLAFGYQNTVGGRYATGWGGQNTVSGQYGTAWGSHNTASGAHSTAFGYYSEASAENGTAIGDSLANSNYMTAIGRFNENVAGQSLTNWVDTDQLFVIGNGSGWQNANRSNALTILKNGTITAPTFSLAEINTAGNTALTTKEYVDSAITAGTNWTQVNDAGTNYLKPIVTHNAIAFGTGSDKGWVSGDDGMLTMGADVIDMHATSGLGFLSDQIDMKGQFRLDTQNNGHLARIYTNNLTGQYIYEFPDYGGDFVVTNNSGALNGDLLTWNGTSWITSSPSAASSNIYTDNGTLNSNRIVDGANHSLAFNNLGWFGLYGANGLGEIEFDGGVIKVAADGAGQFEYGHQDSIFWTGTQTTSDIEIRPSNTTATITDSRVTTKGLEYAADYSANYTNRTLVDKEYVDDTLALVIAPGTQNHIPKYNAAGTGIEESGISIDANSNLIMGGEDRKISWNSLESITKTSSGAGGSVIRFSNSLNTANGNTEGGFEFTDHTGVNVMKITDYKVGVGTKNPLSILHANSGGINDIPILTLENTAGDIQMFRTDANPESAITGSIGDIAFDGTNGEAYIKHSGNSTNTGWLRMLRQGDLASLWDTDADTGIQVEESADEDMIRFDIGDSSGSAHPNAMVIDADGEIGIGTSTPSEMLTLYSANAEMEFKSSVHNSGTHTIYFNHGNDSIVGKTFIRSTASGANSNSNLSFGTNNTSGFEITASGQVRSNYVHYLRGNARLGSSVNSGVKYLRFSPDEAKAAIFSVPAGSYGRADLRFTVGDNSIPAEKTQNEYSMIIARNGNVGIGDAITPNALLDVRGDAIFNDDGADADFRIEGDTDVNLFFADASVDMIGIGTNIPTAQLHTTGTVRFANFGAGTMQTDANGNVSVSSDERLKNIQGTFDRGLSELMGINPIEYKWKEKTGYDTENSYYGFSAQNIKLSIPEAVGEDSRGYLTLSDRPILATAINAIKEQQTQIEESKLKIETNILKTDTNIKTLAELQKSVDDNLVIINQSLVTSSEEQEEGNKKINQTIKTNKENIAENTASLATLSENINSLTELTTTLTDTVADHEDRITKIETILAEGGVDLNNNNNIELLEVLKTFVDNLEALEEDGKDIEFTLEGKLIVKEIKTDKLLVSKDAVFEGNVIYTSKDMAGKAVIKEGEKKVEVKFEKEFEEIPYITAVVNNEFILYQVTNVSTEGFEIRIKDEVTKDIEFTWQAIIVKD